MRIISGKYKGRKIEGYKLTNTRPTMDRVRESLFAIIYSKLEDSVCLDLFAGSGALGLEALSEGAKYVYFVDKDKNSCKVINKNLQELNIKEATVINNDFKKALEHLPTHYFDIIFLDPPYKTDYIMIALDLIKKYQLLKKDAYIILESDKALDLASLQKDWKVLKTRKYGIAFITIIANN